MELTYKHINWLLTHLTFRENGYHVVDLSEEAQDLVSCGYASMRPCNLSTYIIGAGYRSFKFSVTTSSKGMEFLEENHKIEYALHLLKMNHPNTALEMIRTMSKEELSVFLVHPEWMVRYTAKQRLERITYGPNLRRV